MSNEPAPPKGPPAEEMSLPRILEALPEALRHFRFGEAVGGREEVDTLTHAAANEPAEVLFERGLAAQQLAASLLESATIRLRGQALNPGHAGAATQAGPMLAAAFLILALEKFVRPGLKALETLSGGHIEPGARSWGVGPWEVLASAVEESRETRRRLQAAWGALTPTERATETGSDFSTAMAQAVASLDAATRDLAEARDHLRNRALHGLSSASRLLLRLESLSRQAEHWREELHGAAQSLSLIGASEIDPTTRQLAAWLVGELDSELGQGLAAVESVPARFRSRNEKPAGPAAELAS